jgi:hypothetical protein
LNYVDNETYQLVDTRELLKLANVLPPEAGQPAAKAEAVVRDNWHNDEVPEY